MLRFFQVLREVVAAVLEDITLALRQSIRRGRLDLIIFQILVLGFAVVLVISLRRVDPAQLAKWFNQFFRPGQESIAPVIAAVLVAATFVVTFTVRYLRTDFDTKVVDSRRERELHDVWRLVNRLEQSKSGLTTDDRVGLIAEIRDKAALQMVDEFDKRLREKYASMEATRRAEHMRTAAERMLERLRAEIRALVKRGNLNLGIGMAVTGVGAFILIYIALTVKPSADAWRSYAPSYLLRLSAVLFTEIFAFFFLGLYRANLTEIKYFQNEITNLEAKCLAFEFAILSGDQKAANKIAGQLAETERNFVLKKDQTTVELEKARLDSQHLHELAGVVKELVPSRKGKTA